MKTSRDWVPVLWINSQKGELCYWSAWFWASDSTFLCYCILSLFFCLLWLCWVLLWAFLLVPIVDAEHCEALITVVEMVLHCQKFEVFWGQLQDCMELVQRDVCLGRCCPGVGFPGSYLCFRDRDNAHGAHHVIVQQGISSFSVAKEHKATWSAPANSCSTYVLLKMLLQNKRFTVPNDYRLSCTGVMQPKSNDTQCSRWSDPMLFACNPAEQLPLCCKEIIWPNEWTVHITVCAQAALHQLPLPIERYRSSELPTPAAVEVHSDIHGLAHPVRQELRGHHSADLELSLHAQIPWVAVRFSSVIKSG